MRRRPKDGRAETDEQVPPSMNTNSDGSLGPRSAVKTRPRQTRRRIAVLKIARREAKKFLTPGQYLHAKDLVRELVAFGGGLRDDIDVQQFGEFWELRDKGGVLGRINLRIYFAVLVGSGDVVILHVDKKEEDGKAASHVRFRLRQRLRAYTRGELEEGLIFYP